MRRLDGASRICSERRSAAPAEARDALLNAALEELDARQQNDSDAPLTPSYEQLAEDLVPALRARLATGGYHGQLARRLLELLIEHAPSEAVETCRQLAELADADLALLARQGLAGLDPATTVAELTAARPQPDELVAVVPHLPIDRLGDSGLIELARLLLDRFPIAEDPPRPSTYFSDSWIETRDTRYRALDRLAELGQFDALEVLATDRPEPDRSFILSLARRARARATDRAFEPPSPRGLMDLLARGDARLIRSSADLLEVVIEHLRAIEDTLQRQHASRYLWNLGPRETRPKREDEISDWVRRELESRLGTGSVVDREIEVTRRAAHGFGTRIDLTATRTTATQPADTARLVIEAKLVSNRHLLTALHDQLVIQYLIPSGWTHGLYLVYWVPTEQRPADWRSSLPTSQADLSELLDGQAAEVEEDLIVRPVILDISRPDA